MDAEQIIIIFYIFYFIFCSMYLVLFSIVLYRTIVTVYTVNNFLYNYRRQMHQIIHLSPVGCFTPARGKSVQKNHEVSRVKKKRKHIQWVIAPIRVQVKQETPDLTRPEGKGGKSRRWSFMNRHTLLLP